MRKLSPLICSTLLLTCSATHAEWILIARDNDLAAQRFALYIDSSSIVRKEENVTVRVLLNMRQKTDEGISSVIAIDEYDCLSDRMRSRSITSYADRDGKGRIVRDYKNLDIWVAVEPGKINDAVLQNVCDLYPDWWSE